ncbi:CPCC family cysteine-rich protein [Singulisphaera rosea]
MEPTPEELERRTRWFEWYVEQQASNSVRRPEEGGPYHCPCCGCRTLDERGGSEICEVCFWEDDGQDDHDAEVVRGGPNGALSLSEARANYLRFGACEETMLENVRSPRPEERPEPGTG